jgi:hypothetical protein
MEASNRVLYSGVRANATFSKHHACDGKAAHTLKKFQ